MAAFSQKSLFSQIKFCSVEILKTLLQINGVQQGPVSQRAFINVL